MNYAYITGTSRGLGKALASELLNRDDFIVYGLSRSNIIKHPRFKHIHIDLNNMETVSSFNFEYHQDAQSLLLINNSGTLGQVKPIGKQNYSRLLETFMVNAISPAILMDSFARMYQNIPVKKVIINVSSGAGRHPFEAWAGYCSGKAAIDMMSKVFDSEQKNMQHTHSIRVFSVAPGIIDTQMQDEIRTASSEDFPKLQTFIDYKQKGMLSDPKKVALQYIKLFEHADRFSDVILDVRQF